MPGIPPASYKTRPHRQEDRQRRGIATHPDLGLGEGCAASGSMEESFIMADMTDMTDKTGRADSLLLRMGVIGTAILALRCFTPVLVVLLGIVGLAALAGWLDVVLLLPALAVFVGLTVYAVWRRRRRRMKTA